MPKANPDTILLTQKDISIQAEATAAGDITPGDLIERTSSGNVQRHSAAGGNSMKMVAVENDLEGNGIGDNYLSADNDQVLFRYGQRGEMYYMQLADGENVSEGDLLESNGAGKLQANTQESASVSTLAVVGEAQEDVDATSSAGGGPARIRVRIA